MIQGYELLGLCGVAAGIYAYARVQWRRDYAKSWSYSLFNLVNGILLEISLFHDWNFASFTGNAIWIVISLYGLYRCSKYERKDKDGSGPLAEALSLKASNDLAPPTLPPAQRVSV